MSDYIALIFLTLLFIGAIMFIGVIIGFIIKFFVTKTSEYQIYKIRYDAWKKGDKK